MGTMGRLLRYPDKYECDGFRAAEATLNVLVAAAIAVSDSPLAFDRARWRPVLLSYVIDGRGVIDVSYPKQMEKLEEIIGIPEDPTGRILISVESNNELRSRLQNRLIITDDNMGLEWR
jgi:hypothetical protein